jgi:hypothetical protein
MAVFIMEIRKKCIIKRIIRIFAPIIAFRQQKQKKHAQMQSINYATWSCDHIVMADKNQNHSSFFCIAASFPDKIPLFCGIFSELPE